MAVDTQTHHVLPNAIYIDFASDIATWTGYDYSQNAGYREKRISEKDYLKTVVDLAGRVARREHGRDMPESIKGDTDAQAVFGVLEPILKEINGGVAETVTADVAQSIIGIVKDHHIVDVWSNEMAQNNMRNAIDDYFFDVVRDEKGIYIPLDLLDDIELRIMDIARARFPG